MFEHGHRAVHGGGGGVCTCWVGFFWGGGDCLEDRNEKTRSTLERRMGYATNSAAAEPSIGYKLGSAFFVMTPFRYNVSVQV